MRNVNESKSTSTNHLLTLKFLDFSLRLCVIPLSVASIWLIVTNKQVNIYGKLEFNNLMGLKYLVCINAISAGYALVAIVLSWLQCLTSDWVFFVSDQVLAYLMVTSGSAVIEILYLVYNGDKEVSWSEACSSYGRFCLKAKVSLILHLMTLVCFLILCLISAYKLFSKFEAPYISSTPDEGE